MAKGESGYGQEMKVQAAYVFAFARILREAGHDPSLLIGAAGPLEEEEFYRLCGRAVALTGDPSLGLRFGSSLHLGSHGVLGHALMSCRTLRQAAEFLVRHNPVGTAQKSIRFAFDQEGVVLTLTPTVEVPGAPAFLPEAFFAATVTALEELVGADLEGCRLEFAFRPQMPEEIYRRYLRLPIAFNRPANRLIGPREAVDRPLAAAGNAIADMFVRQCGELLRKRGQTESCALDVRRILAGERGHLLNEYEVARALNISSRTLRRRLLGEGESFQLIRDDVRNGLAKSCLGETELSVAEIGALLGFEDTANFRRAFRRWNGCSPQKFRTVRLGAERMGEMPEAQAASSRNRDERRGASMQALT